MATKIEKIRHIALFIVFLVIFTSTAGAFTPFDDDDDLSPTICFAASDSGDDTVHGDDSFLGDVALLVYLCLPACQAGRTLHPDEVIVPIKNVSLLGQSSRAPPSPPTRI